MSILPRSSAGSYLIFQHWSRPDLLCAVRDGDELPAFLDEDWIALKVLEEHGERPIGFDEGAARFSCAMQGFYVFHRDTRRLATSLSREKRSRAA
ncbi:MAG TPA: hypothetical protein VHL98_13735 [Microvirga sp.]|jgi:hypothetical protein|nr:hypothetical protein [Microvirga sp.]